jgi:hypothetical protein
LLAWLKTPPAGSYTVLLGTDIPEDAVTVLFAKVTKEGVSLVQWLAEKLQRGELQLNANTKIGLPQGVVLE